MGLGLNQTGKLINTHLGNRLLLPEGPTPQGPVVVDHDKLLDALVSELMPVDIRQRANLRDGERLCRYHIVVVINDEIQKVAKKNGWSLCLDEADHLFAFNGDSLKEISKKRLLRFLSEAAENLGVTPILAQHHITQSQLLKQFYASGYLLSQEPTENSNQIFIPKRKRARTMKNKASKKNRTPKSASNRPIPTIELVEEYLNRHYDFRFNIVTKKTEVRGKGEAHFTPIDDYIENSLHRELLKADLKVTERLLLNVLRSDFVPAYDPFKSYLAGLPPWDQKTDFIKLLAQTVKTTNDELWWFCFKKWMVALVASLLDEKVCNHCVIVLSGGQGIGKTTWLLGLVPPELQDYRFSGTINPNNKDTLVQLSETMLILLDELENLNRSELNSLKELITKVEIRLRRVFMRHSENMIRRSSFAGAVNDRQFLTDTTGNRRFLCFETTHIDLGHKVPLEGVFAQAKHLFESKFQYWFDASEIELINANNEQYMTVSIEEEVLLRWFEPCEKETADVYWATTPLALWLVDKGLPQVTHSVVKALGRALNRHGFKRMKKGNVSVYALKYRQLASEKPLKAVG